MSQGMTLACDFSEDRVTLDRLAAYIDGRDWDMSLSSNVLLDFVTATGMLAPVMLQDDWQTSATGQNKRLGVGDYVLTNSNWDERVMRFEDDTFINSLNFNEKVYTAATLDKNQGFYLAWIDYNPGIADFVQMECGFGEGTESDVRLRVYSGGKCEVYRNGHDIMEANLFEEVDYPQKFSALRKKGKGAKSKQAAGQVIELFMIPFRHREMLIFSNQGGGFNVEFSEIDENDNEPEITGASKFWWYVPEGQATVQGAPMQFATSGYLLSVPYYLRYAPDENQGYVTNTTGSSSGFGSSDTSLSLVLLDGSTPFSANGNNSTLRFRVDLSGDGKANEFIYGASVAFDGQVKSTANTPIFLDNYVTGYDLNVGEEVGSVTSTIKLMQPSAVESLGVRNAKTITNRAVEASIGTVAFFTGRVDVPDFKERVTDEVSEIIWACRDYSMTHEKYIYQDPSPYDSFNMSDAIFDIATLPGHSEFMMDIDDIDLQLPGVSGASKGEYLLLPEPGDKASDWLRRLHETFDRTAIYGWVPTVNGPVFRWRRKENLPLNASVTLYQKDADAAAAGKGSGAWQSWYRTFDQKTLPPECNDLWVVGRDPRTRLPIIGHDWNPTSLDPTVPVNQRGEDWFGDLRRYSWVDPALGNQELVNYCLGILRSRLFPVRKMVEIECDFLLKSDGSPVWRGDCIRLDKKGLYRVVGFSGNHELEKGGVNNDIWRPYRYTVEYISA